MSALRRARPSSQFVHLGPSCPEPPSPNRLSHATVHRGRSEVSRINDDEMHALMREIVDRLYTFHRRIDDPAFRAEIDRWAAMTAKWDAPKPDPVLSAIPAETPERG